LIRCKQVQRLKVVSYTLSEHVSRNLFDVLDDRKIIESLSNTTLEMALKTSFIIMHLRSFLQRYSPRIYQILWRTNEANLWNSLIAIKRRALLHKPTLTQKEVVSWCCVQHASDEELFFRMKRYVHLMPQHSHSLDAWLREEYVCLETTNTWLNDAYKY